MTDSTRDPWQPARPWQIVRADLDLAHVFMPMSSFRFEQVTDPAGGVGYKIVHNNQAPHPDCFCDTIFRPAGNSQPTFEKIAARKTLPLFDKSHAQVYQEASDKLLAFLDKDREVKRLEGVVRVPCHAHGATTSADALEGHTPLWVKTFIHVYQFENVIDGDRPFLLLRAPLSPLCPTNSDGSAAGIA
ncbi:MAG: hypothetical protein QOI59_6933 [Gammaproteobacteria bacterium]|jgi:hypothetical protein|nr:hypothetical protein [Gammaproteobacteria bacterium]